MPKDALSREPSPSPRDPIRSDNPASRGLGPSPASHLLFKETKTFRIILDASSLYTRAAFFASGWCLLTRKDLFAIWSVVWSDVKTFPPVTQTRLGTSTPSGLMRPTSSIFDFVHKLRIPKRPPSECRPANTCAGFG